jgi:hypothetical protein
MYVVMQKLIQIGIIAAELEKVEKPENLVGLCLDGVDEDVGHVPAKAILLAHVIPNKQVILL